MSRKRKKRKKKPYKKLTLKDLDQLEIYKRLRKTWAINPKTRVKPNKKKYNRQQEKQKIKKEINND